MSAEPIGVAVALFFAGVLQVLMGERRAEKVYPLHWEFPGGKRQKLAKPRWMRLAARTARRTLDRNCGC